MLFHRSTRGTRLPALCALALLGGCEAGEIRDSQMPGAGAPGRMGGDQPPPTTSPPGGAASAERLPQRRLRRLSNREYNNVIRDLLGDDSRPADPFLVDSYPNGFDNGSAGLTVQVDQAAAYQKAAETLAEKAAGGNLAALAGGCRVAVQGEAACRVAFLSSFPRRAFRRPLTPTEAQRVDAAFSAGAASGGLAGGVQLVLELLLQSPQFLYREELGPPDQAARAGRVRLTSHEMASQLSFLLTGTMPDAELFAAADAGRLETPEQVGREAARLLRTPRAREAVRELVIQWLAVDHLDGLSKDEEVYPMFNPQLVASMQRDIDALVDRELWGQEGSLRALLTSTEAVVDAPLARLYGVPAPAGTAARPATLDATVRSGILTRAAFLAAHAAADGGGPISRGVFVLSNLLCNDIPQPPADVPTDPPIGDEGPLDLTSRPGVSIHSSDPRCITCHAAIDGIGFGFEQFDGIGALRTTYPNGKPVDTSGNLLGTDVDGPFVGVAELSTRLANSQVVRDCFARQLYRFAMGAVEAPDSGIEARLYGLDNRSRITDALVTLVGRESFFVRAVD